MDKMTTRLLLESYRPQDATEPIFAEALREVAADPELAAWFEDMQKFDAALAAKFQEIPVSADLKNHILLGHRVAPNVVPFPRTRITAIVGALAAMFALTLFSWHLFAPPLSPMSPLGMKAISFTNSMPPLQFVCFNPAAVSDWINEQPDAKKMGIAMPRLPQSLSMKVIGSSVVDWNGKPVVMVCMQNGKQMAMLYILKGSDIAGLKDGTNEIMRHKEWVVRESKENGQVRLLATRGGPEDLNFPTPF